MQQSTSKVFIQTTNSHDGCYSTPRTMRRTSPIPNFALGNVATSPCKPFPSASSAQYQQHVTCSTVLEPYTYIESIPGKNVRDLLLDSFNHWLGVDAQALDTIKQVVAQLHTASLVVDDIEDESPTRRGQRSAHIVYGTARALNAGNYVYFLALERLMQLRSGECIEIFTGEMLNLHRGQGRDIYWRETFQIPSEQEYCDMVVDKTGGLFRLAIRTLFALSPNFVATAAPIKMAVEANLIALSDDLAQYFQIRDDLINLASPEFHLKKGFCEDITEGKLSFIVLHSLRQHNASAQAEELRSILKSKTTDRARMRRALALMHATRSFDYTLAYLTALEEKLAGTIQALGDNPFLLGLLRKIAKEVEDCHGIERRVIHASY